MRRTSVVFLTVLSLAASAQAADLPVLKAAPPPPPGPKFFSWVEGGWSSFKLSPVHGFDYVPPVDGATFLPTTFEIDRGWYGRGEAGVTGIQSLGLINGISVAARYREGSSDLERNGLNTISLSYLSPSASYAGTGGSDGLAYGNASQKFSLFDVELRFKHSLAGLPGVTFNAEPFYGRLDHDVSAGVGTLQGFPPLVTRTAQLDGEILGIQAALESQRQITPGFGVRGRLSIGAYRISTDVDFSILDPGDFAAANSFSRNLNGLRAGAEIGADFALTPHITLGVTAGVDYWSKMPFPQLTRNLGGGALSPPVGIGEDNFTDYFVGARLTFATGNP